MSDDKLTIEEKDGQIILMACKKRVIKVVIPNNVTQIGEDAFKGCTALESIKIPNSIISIGYGAFAECTALRPNSVIYRGTAAQ